MRGEYLPTELMTLAIEGSPPLAWGILGIGAIVASAGRITPTCVGNTEDDQAGCQKDKDHPHLRGEY
ncbi:hypothetical protein ACADC178_0813 [Lactobacillus delbrueckii subsp. lactis]|nr:hypothetical protein ACADC178_0813 [Lactobacillus delbrueckii subsp. lactis]